MERSPETHIASLRQVFVCSLVAYLIGFIVSTIAHEGAHAIAARLLGVPTVLYHNYTRTPGDVPADAYLWLVTAGPLTSLLLGAGCLAASYATRRPTVFTLIGLWTGMHAMNAFFGYLVLGAFLSDGDTGKIHEALSTPLVLRWVVAIAGFAMIVMFNRAVASLFERHAPQKETEEGHSRVGAANALIAFPALAGTIGACLLTLPAPTWISLAYPATVGFLSLIAYRVMRRRKAPLPPGMRYPRGLPVFPVALLFLLIALSVWLTRGLSL